MYKHPNYNIAQLSSLKMWKSSVYVFAYEANEASLREPQVLFYAGSKEIAEGRIRRIPFSSFEDLGLKLRAINVAVQEFHLMCHGRDGNIALSGETMTPYDFEFNVFRSFFYAGTVRVVNFDWIICDAVLIHQPTGDLQYQRLFGAPKECRGSIEYVANSKRYSSTINVFYADNTTVAHTGLNPELLRIPEVVEYCQNVIKDAHKCDVYFI